MDRLVLTAIVGLHPLGRFGIEDRLECKFGEASLDITRCSCAVSCEDITPVTLAVNEQIFLTELDECVSDGRITVRVVLHRLADDVRHLVIFAVINRLHGMQNTALDGL